MVVVVVVVVVVQLLPMCRDVHQCEGDLQLQRAIFADLCHDHEPLLLLLLLVVAVPLWVCELARQQLLGNVEPL